MSDAPASVPGPGVDAPAGGLDVTALLARVEAEGAPLLDRGRTIFVFRGAADAVRVRHWVYGLPSTLDLVRAPGTDVWHGALALPPHSRVEYKLEVDRGGRTELVRDPLNPRLAHDPYGANSVVHGAGYEVPEWTQPDPGVRPGRLEKMEIPSSAFGDVRPVTVYLPARLHPRRPCPLLVVHDGADYVRYAGLRTVLDNLIDRLEIPRMVVALIQSPDRVTEYAGDERHGRFVCFDLLPRLEAAFPIERDRRARGLMGASFGAVAALSTAWRHPGVFGRLLLQSGSFAFSDVGGPHGRGPVFDPVVRFMDAFRADPGRPADRVFLSCGTYESLIYENRSMVALLEAGTGMAGTGGSGAAVPDHAHAADADATATVTTTGASTGATGGAGPDPRMAIRYVEARDGHNWENWRDRLREGLSWLFPGPLWTVYE